MIVANLIVSDKDEPFLPCALASIEDVADYLVINENSGNEGNPNLEVIEKCALSRQSKIRLVRTTFNGFGNARNICLKETSELASTKGWSNVFILNIDSDEVHTTCLSEIKNALLPKVPDGVDCLDGYYYQFVMSYDYLYSIERRHNMLFRLQEGLFWEGEVHEKLQGCAGDKIPIPYLYFHYGYMREIPTLREKLIMYEKMCRNEKNVRLLEEEKHDTFLDWQARFFFPFRRSHPECMGELIKRERMRRAGDFERMEAVMRREHKNLMKMLASRKRELVFYALQSLRKAQMMVRECLWTRSGK